MIEVFKIIKHKYDYKVAPELIYSTFKVTRGNDIRLLVIFNCYVMFWMLGEEQRGLCRHSNKQRWCSEWEEDLGLQ